MSEEDKQAVTEETEGQSQTVTEESGAQEQKSDDLETLLAEYEKETGSSSEQKTETKSEDGVSREEFEALRQELSNREYQTDLGKTISAVRGDLPSEQFDDAFMDAWLNARAKEDPRIATAWMQRHDDPKKFERVIGGLNKQFAGKYGKFSGRDEDATSDREAVAAAVRGQSNKAPEEQAPDYKSVSDNAFREDVKKRYGINVPI